MNRKFYSVFASLLVINCGGGSDNNSTPPPIAEQPPAPIEYTDTSMPNVNTEVAANFQTILEGMDLNAVINDALPLIDARDPQSIVSLALTEQVPLDGTTLTDIRYDYQRQTLAMWGHLLTHLNTLDRAQMSVVDQVNFDVLKWVAEQQDAQSDYLYYDYPATYFLTGVIPRLERFFVDLHPIQNAQDIDDYLARLAMVDDVVGHLVSNLQEMEANGIVEPSITMQVAINRFNDSANSAVNTSPYITGFTEKLNALNELSASDKQAAIERAEAITTDLIQPAYQQLVAFMNQQISRAPADIGVGQFPNGDAYYRQRLAFHTTTAMTPAQIHELGIQELSRIHTQLDALFNQLGYPANESLKQRFDRAAVDGGFIAAANVQSTYEELIENARVRMLPMFSRFPQADVVVIGGNTGGFYIRASLDGSRPGAFYAVTTSDQPYFTMPSLAYHEALPGHHMQIALAQETELPLFRRNITATGYVEGWGLYAERLAGESGWYDDDIYGDIGRLFYEGLRAARLVVDTGIHEYNWGFDRATAYFEENVGVSLGTAQGNIARYSIYTGQATAYMVGMLAILDMRERMQNARGEQYSITEFHDLVLDSGAVPLTVLENIIDGALEGPNDE